MTRPTREQVDAVLAQTDAGYVLPLSCLVLAAEVRALRAELEHVYELDVQRQKTMDVVVALNNAVSAVLARIEALAEDYEAQSKAELTSLLILRFTPADVASDIRKALRGEL